jgi:hypothetical protein
VFDGRLEAPFNGWTKQHHSQGFTWRPGSVSFGTLIHAGLIDVEVVQRKVFHRRKETTRAIAVPFKVKSRMPVEIASIETEAGSHVLTLPAGDYRLCFETGLAGEKCWIRFTFVATAGAKHEIILADAGLSPTYPLLLTAEPG